jgi:hypothetical protein
MNTYSGGGMSLMKLGRVTNTREGENAGRIRNIGEECTIEVTVWYK